jgi:signal transduction histidine kinase
MGVVISGSIIEAHQCRIWAEYASRGGHGITVRFTVPLQAPKGARDKHSA